MDLFDARAIGIGRILAQQLHVGPETLHQLTPAQFQDFICDRLYAMGFEPKQVGGVYRKDGGIDIFFWPRDPVAFPFLGAAQVKHHRNVRRTEGSPTVRDFAGAIAGHPVSAAMIVTNTSFTADALWWRERHAQLVRLRSFNDVCRWIRGDFSDSAEWREIPSKIELCPGVIVDVGPRSKPEAGQLELAPAGSLRGPQVE